MTAGFAWCLPGTGRLLLAKLAASFLLYELLLLAFNEWRLTRQQIGTLRSALVG